MTVEEIARSKVPNEEDSFFHYSDQNIWVEGFVAGYNSAKPKEVTKCPHCGSDKLKWAFRFVKKCETCNEVFPCEL